MSSGFDWSCPTCGVTVPGGCTHFCQTTGWPSGVVVESTFPEIDPLVRIADALERIADNIAAPKEET